MLGREVRSSSLITWPSAPLAKSAQSVLVCSAISKPAAWNAATAASAIRVPGWMYDVARTHSQSATEQPGGLSAMNVSNWPLVPPLP